MRVPNRKYTDRILSKAYHSHNTTINLLRYSKTGATNIYGETLGKTYLDPIRLPGHLEMYPSELHLRELGWDKDSAQMIFRMPFKILLEEGLATVAENGDITLEIKTDDRMEIPFDDKIYQIAKIHMKEPFVDGQPTFVWLGGRKKTSGN